MSQAEDKGYKPDVVGKRVRHNCEDPNCTLQGTVIDLITNPNKPPEEPIEWFAVVKFDPHKDLPPDYTAPFPLNGIKVIEDE